MVNRRQFLKTGAAGLVGASVFSGKAAAHEAKLDHGGRDYSFLSGVEREPVPTACALCASRCPAIGYVERGQLVKIEGQPDSIRTDGTLCAKGQAGVNQMYDPDRILTPMRRTGKRGEGKWKKIGWDEALDELAGRLRKLRDAGEPEKFMLHHGWISTSADRLVNKVFLPTYGTATVADNSCLGQSARTTAHELTWGGYEDNWDFDNSRYVLNFGSNVLEAHTNHVALARRLSFGLAEGRIKMVTFDVRLSNTASKSDTWIQIRPGTDLAVILAMCQVIMVEELFRGRGEQFLEFCRVTPDVSASMDAKVAALRGHLKSYTPKWAEKISGVPAGEIIKHAREFAKTAPACVISSRGASAHYNGVETERAIQMLAAITGNVDARGGRCLAVAPEWRHPTGPVEKPVARKLNILEGFENEALLPVHGVGHQVLKKIRDGGAGRPEVYLWYNYNPVFSNADVRASSEILKDESLIPFTVAVTPFYDESAALADMILPDALYLERYDFEDGVSPNQVAEYYVRQPVIPPRGESRDFKDVCCDLATRMGFPLGFGSGEDFVKKSLDMTPVVKEKAGGSRRLLKNGVWHDPKAAPAFGSYRQTIDPKALVADAVILDDESGVYWNWKQAGVANEETARRQGYRSTPGAHEGYVGQLIWGEVYAGFRPANFNKSGYFEIYSSILAQKGMSPLPAYVAIPEHKDMKDDEVVMTTFRVNVQTLSTTQNCMWLDEINTDNPAWINPETAAARGIADGDAIKIASTMGEIEATAKVTENAVPGIIALSSHGGRWEYGRYASSKKAPFAVDKDSPQERLKWWTYDGVHPNWIIDNASEPISGQQRWMDTIVTVTKA